ncbi:hypothetical protein ACFC96_00115 [Streptomyces sp. NPDC055955]|uniref:hypothetical protein n=1 Tax=Streptomyces sp. NPDC055955 TaxID=3345665 RepID=UPI0035D58044
MSEAGQGCALGQDPGRARAHPLPARSPRLDFREVSEIHTPWATEEDTVLGLSRHWNNERACGDLRIALDNWIAHRRPAARDVADLNHLAHGLVNAGMTEWAGNIFRLLDNQATEVPWSYTGNPEQLFIRWRDQTTAR